MNMSRKAISVLIKVNDYSCANCTKETEQSNTQSNQDDMHNLTDIIEDPEENIKASDIVIEKYDNMIFNLIRFQNNRKDEELNEITNDVPKCNYLTTGEFSQTFRNKDNKTFSILNANVRSINKNFEKLKECMIKSTNHSFTVIGLSETHLKEPPSDYYHLDGYNMEFTNRVNREKGGVCLYISDEIKYILRKDLICKANENFESCFVDIDNPDTRNTLIKFIDQTNKLIYHREKFCQLQVSFRFLETRALIMLG